MQPAAVCRWQWLLTSPLLWRKYEIREALEPDGCSSEFFNLPDSDQNHQDISAAPLN